MIRETRVEPVLRLYVFVQCELGDMRFSKY
jgi:hypothetical protein